ncbi:MAG TPA: response regulator [Rectinemataceae bacterium]|nr:response regulator [Rectinemataceae bacterium]
MDSKKRILLVDDEQINLEFFEVMLTKLGFEVEKADNGNDALEMVKRWKPDLVILDNVMPKLSGWEVTRIIKTSEEFKDFAEVPIIMFSAMDDVKDKVEGLELGADDYITKPFNFSEVLARIRAVLRTRELIHQIEHREARIRVAEEIADRVLGFANGLREPFAHIAREATALEPECGDARPFVQRVRSETKRALDKLDELDQAVASLTAEAESLKDAETALPTIKTKYRGHAPA